MNKSDLTRGEQVLKRLRDASGDWVDGTELATAAVGGSEGLKRLRELRAAGHPIEERHHPEGLSIWQYRLVPTYAPPPIPAGHPVTSVVTIPSRDDDAFFDPDKPYAPPATPKAYVCAKCGKPMIDVSITFGVPYGRCPTHHRMNGRVQEKSRYL